MEVEEINLRCRVCGFRDLDLPYGVDGQTFSFEYCPCCGVQHGYQDASIEGIRKYRKAWLAKGAHWDLPRLKPANWNLKEQLSQIPEEYQ